MKVSEILSAAAHLCSRPDLAQYLKNRSSNDTASAQKDADLLLRCYNIVENEIALEYKPLIANQQIYAHNGIVAYRNLTEQLLDIVSVYDEYQNKLFYKTYAEYLKTAPKNVTVTYSYLPVKKKPDDTSAYSGTKICERILAMGVACEFMLISGLYDEAILWDKRYKDSLLKVCQVKTAGRRMPTGRWR